MHSLFFCYTSNVTKIQTEYKKSRIEKKTVNDSPICALTKSKNNKFLYWMTQKIYRSIKYYISMTGCARNL